MPTNISHDASEADPAFLVEGGGVELKENFEIKDGGSGGRRGVGCGQSRRTQLLICCLFPFLLPARLIV